MKFKRERYHIDLQGHLRLLSITPYIFRFRWVVWLLNFFTNRSYKGKDIEGILCDEVYIPSKNENVNIRTRIYRPEGERGTLPAMLYIHGGGYLVGNPEQSARIVKKFISKRPCVIIAPDYRKAYSKPYPAGFNDCYDALLWIKENAQELKIRPDKLMVAGHSAGGGLTAAVTLKARDTGDANIAFQMPFYPMIDDCQPSDPARDMQTPVWNTFSNKIAWNAYLANLHKQNKKIPAYAAPARETDYRNLPPTISFVGELEPFYQETVNYIKALRTENTNVIYKEYPGCFHCFEWIVPKAQVSKEAQDFTYQAYADFYDLYLDQS